MPALETNSHFEILLLCFLRRRQQLSDARRIRRHRLLHENVFALPHRFLEVHRTKPR